VFKRLRRKVKQRKTVTSDTGPPTNRQHYAAKAHERIRLRALYDAAQTTDENSNHWANADNLSADAAADPGIRQTVRNRARYEVANNTYARGLLLTLANDVIGTGPKLQMRLDETDSNRSIERAFNERQAPAIRFAEKLRTLRVAKGQDGEGFGLYVHNPGLNAPVPLDIRPLEADYFTNPEPSIDDDNSADGIFFDEYGNELTYRVLRSHPGDLSGVGFGNEYDDVPAAYVAHWFRADRPGQHRGLPDIMPALPLFAMLRRFTLAVIAAAETAADFAAVIQAKNSPVDEAGPGIEAMDPVELERRMATVLPEGYEIGQIRAEQPATTYAEFKREILTEIARCLSVPYNIDACDSSSYNYASGRLDHQTYWKSIDVERDEVTRAIVEPYFSLWLRLYLSDRSGIAPEDIDLGLYPHTWHWPGREHVDPDKEAKAQDKKLKNKSSNYQLEYGRQGLDYETELRQCNTEDQLKDRLALERIAARKEAIADLGLTPEDLAPSPPPKEEPNGNPREKAEAAA